IEGWRFDGAETTVAGPSRLGGKLPLVLAAVKILVDAARDKAVEPANRLLQPTSFDVKHRCELGERGGARHRPRDGTADRAVGERISLEVLRVENQISREIGMTNRQMRPRPLPRMSCRRRSATRSASQFEAPLRPPQAICSSAVTKQGTSCGASTRSHQSPNSSPEISSASTVRPAVWAPGALS